MSLFVCSYYRLGVDHVFKLEPAMNMGGKDRFYITRPDLQAVSQISGHIVSDNKSGQERNYSIIFVPRVLASCEHILEEEGVYGFVKIFQWKLLLIPLDAHLLSLERHDAFRSLYINQDYTVLHSIARSLLLLESVFGTFTVMHGKGHYAQKVWELFVRLKELGDKPRYTKAEGPGISEVLLFDRQCDLITPLCSQLTYEGILDDVFQIRSGYVSISKEISGKEQDTNVLLNSKDLVFNEIRSLHFAATSPVLVDISRNLKETYHEGKSSDSIPALKSFVQRLPELTKKHDSLATHLQVSEQIVTKKKREEFQRQLFYERAILEAADKTPVSDYIEEIIQCQVDFRVPLRLLCLMSTTNNGIKQKYFRTLKHQYLQSYGHKHLVTFHNLQTVGLIQHKAEEQSSSVAQHAKSTFKLLSKQLKLIPKDPSSYDVHVPKDMSYVYGGAYKPLSCAAVEHVVKTRSWKGLDDIVRSWTGPVFTHSQPTSLRRETVVASQAQKVVLVYFIGGCTFSEINALRFLGEKTKTHYVIATTNIISPNRLIESVLGNDD